MIDIKVLDPWGTRADIIYNLLQPARHFSVELPDLGLCRVLFEGLARPPWPVMNSNLSLELEHQPRLQRTHSVDSGDGSFVLLFRILGGLTFTPVAT